MKIAFIILYAFALVLYFLFVIKRLKMLNEKHGKYLGSQGMMITYTRLVQVIWFLLAGLFILGSIWIIWFL